MPEPMLSLTPFSFPLLMLGVMAAVFYFTSSRQRAKGEALRQLSSLLPGVYKPGFFTPSYSGEYEGLPFKVHLVPASRNTPIQLLITVDISPSFELTVYKENFILAAGASLGLLKDIETSDPAFNKEFILSGDHGGLAPRYLEDMQRRQDIRGLFNSGYRTFSITKRGLRAVKPNYDTGTDLSPSPLAERIKSLCSLARAARLY